ncbi:transglycosylase domain-containing protein [Candidatus Binatia bacterium]|nr:transglycosylase domain-containing protein [Candidatus Binatia bacterium]
MLTTAPLALGVTAPPPLAWRALRRLARLTAGVMQLCAGLLAGGALVYEAETSALQARLFAAYAARLSYTTDPGPSPLIAFPRDGPFDEQRGYSRIPRFQARLEDAGFRIAAQARVSEELAQLVSWGVPPPYREPAVVGLRIRAAGGGPLYERARQTAVFDGFDDIPPLLVQSLLFIENRELLDPRHARTNPVIEWDRLAMAGLVYAGSKVGLPLGMQGGSTLATQLEKYRHSPRGRTDSLTEKLRQVSGATLKAYRDGEDTRHHRRQIVLDYFNTMPLAAVPGQGSLYGFGNGLRAWFGVDVEEVATALAQPDATVEKARAYKHALALLAAVRAPTTYLVRSREQLERRIGDYVPLLVEAGIIDLDLAGLTLVTPLTFVSAAPSLGTASYVERKALNGVRTRLLKLLDLPGLYDLDRLHLEVDATVDTALQAEVVTVFGQLADKQFIGARGLNARRLLQQSDPSKVTYSLLLYERTPLGNLLRVQADSLDQPFDVNEGLKLELGSTAKLRTLAHYLESVAELHRELQDAEPATLALLAARKNDPLTKWVAETMLARPGIGLEELLEEALERRYSASPGEVFFTGGGRHVFNNFDRRDNGKKFTVREALRRSSNLVFIRIMRDLVRYHEARLPYDSAAVLSQTDHPERKRMLEAIADADGQKVMAKAYRTYRDLPPEGLVGRLLGDKIRSARHLAILYFAWHRGGDAGGLAEWMARWGVAVPPAELHRLARAYGGPRLSLADFAYLLRRHPLEIWCAGQLLADPSVGSKELIERSAAERLAASSWLLATRQRRAQDTRLRIRIEEEAFQRMTPYWQRLGFPFARLVPSYATAIGSSADRPAALAELMGIIVNDGMRRPLLRLTGLQFARGTPYETVFEPDAAVGERVMEPTVAQVLRTALVGVVEAGTARRVAGAFVGPDGRPLVVGGKTGSGDNRVTTFTRGGGVRSSRAVSRTATFVFFIDDRYFGVLTALVPGKEAGHYGFTSALPLSVLRLTAPMLNQRLRQGPAEGGPLLQHAQNTAPIPDGVEAAMANPAGSALKNARF